MGGQCEWIYDSSLARRFDELRDPVSKSLKPEPAGGPHQALQRQRQTDFCEFQASLLYESVALSEEPPHRWAHTAAHAHGNSTWKKKENRSFIPVLCLKLLVPERAGWRGMGRRTRNSRSA